MNTQKAKTIQILLNNGTLEGIMNIADTAWNLSGEMYVSPRELVTELVSLNKYGVYLLLSKDRVYVGQASDLERRIKQHLAGKDWWEQVVLLTTQDDRFTRSDIDYLESVLIKKAESLQTLDSDNRNKGNAPKVDKFRKVDLDQYLDEAKFLMELIGVNVFSNSKKKNSAQRRKSTITIAASQTATQESQNQDNTAIEPKEKTESQYNLDSYDWSLEARNKFDCLNSEILKLSPDIHIVCRKHYISFKYKTNVADVVVLKKDYLFIFVNARFDQIHDSKGICEDYTGRGHLGVGDVCVRLRNLNKLDDVLAIIKQSLALQMN